MSLRVHAADVATQPYDATAIEGSCSDVQVVLVFVQSFLWLTGRSFILVRTRTRCVGTKVRVSKPWRRLSASQSLQY